VGETKYTEEECKERDLTYAAPLKARLRLVINEEDPDTKEKKIKDFLECLDGVVEIGAVRVVSVSEVKDLTQSIVTKNLLYASDALHLATAIHTSADVLWVADDHFKKRKVKNLAKQNNLEIKHIKEIKIDD